MKELPPALVLDLSATGVAVARILAKHKVDVYGADVDDFPIGRFSKYVKRPFFGYKIKLDDNNLFNVLIEFSLKLGTKPVLFPSSDIFIEFVSKHFDVLKDYYLMQGSLAPNISFKFLDKKEFYKLCEENDVPYPKTILLTGGETYDCITAKLRFPIILKPFVIHKWKKYLRGNKIILINDPQDLKRILSTERTLLENSMLQEVIPGSEDNIFIFKGYFNKEGKLLARFTGRKIRQYPPNFGSASLAESIPNEDVERLSRNFLEKIKFYGLCGAEFKYDPRDDEYKMVEVNIRPQLWEDITRISEREIVWIAYCDLAGLEIPLQGKQRYNVRWVYLTRDIVSGLWHIRNNNTGIFEWLKSYRGVKGEALVDFRDLGMLLSIPAYTFYQFYKYKV